MSIRKKMIEWFDPSVAQATELDEVSLEEMLAMAPHEAHAAWVPAPDRPDPVELLRSQGKTRVKQLLPLRYERMSVSSFTFYRGGALIMAADLSDTPITGIHVQACGDAHISNFGLFSSPEQTTVFDINDFDETHIGPWEWDVKRLAASVEICGLDNGFSKKERKQAVLACVRAYREAMLDFAGRGHLDVWYAHLNIDKLFNQYSEIFDAKTVKATEKMINKAKGKDSLRAAQKLTEVVDGELRIISNPPLVVPLRDLVATSDNRRLVEHFDEQRLKEMMGDILSEYRATLDSDKRRLISEYTPVDIAHKVVGVGSVGTRAWILVLQGANEHDPLVLQVKEAQDSVLERFVGKSKYPHHGHRVVSGQRAMQSTSDMLLGWCTIQGLDGKNKDYYVRQLWNGKGSIDLSILDAERLATFAEICGWTLAHAHARTGNRFAIASYLGETDSFDKAIAKFARAYGKQNEADYQRFMEALEAGELLDDNA